jgi:ATP-dependent Zn protease
MMKRRLNGAQREATAFHEAGHAVVAWYLGYPPDLLTIVPTDTKDGMLSYPNPLQGLDLEFDESDDALRRKECAIMIRLAGPTAQRHNRPRSWRSRHGQSDHEHVFELALAIHRSDRGAVRFIKWSDGETMKILMNRWHMVERLARELLSRRTMSGAEIAAFLNGCDGVSVDGK